MGRVVFSVARVGQRTMLIGLVLVRHHLLLGYGLYKKMEIYVRHFRPTF